MNRVPTPFARLVINRSVPVVVNLLLLFIGLSILREMVHLLATPADDSSELVSMDGAIAIMLYGYGVSLELRPTFMKTFAFYPEHHGPLQDAVDQICRRYGILLVLDGLFLEILVQLIEIPSRIINTHPAESVLIAVGVAAVALTVLLLVRFCLRLVQAAPGRG